MIVGVGWLAGDMSDITFYFDPVCPFAWLTSRWVNQVANQRSYDIEWKFISLRLINAQIDYDAHFPPEYEAGHNAGLRMLRVAAKTRAEHGSKVIGDLYTELSSSIFDVERPADAGERNLWIGTAEHVGPILDSLGLPQTLMDALDDSDWDRTVQAETDEALALTGKDVGTPIISFHGGAAFFGPVISRLPSDEDAVRLWDHVVGLASFPGFAELKRSLRETPRLRAFGVTDAEVGVAEDWHSGSRRQKK